MPRQVLTGQLLLPFEERDRQDNIMQVTDEEREMLLKQREKKSQRQTEDNGCKVLLGR